MPYAIMQKELAAPTLNQLKRAYRALPTLRDLDAQTSLNDAYGILIRGLEVADASALQDALIEEHIDTAVVEESELPRMPAARVIRQIEFTPQHLVLRDPMGRIFNMPANEILVIAAGNVRLKQFKRVKASLEEPQFYGSGITYDTIEGVKSKEETRLNLLLEIIDRGAAIRYSIAGDDFIYNCLGPRKSGNLPQNFSALLVDLVQFATDAGLNRGATQMCERPGEFFLYPSKAAFFEEITWLLWRIAQLSHEAPEA